MFALLLVASALCTLQGDWEKFKVRFGKKYSESEEERRLAIFSDNLRYISLLNKVDSKATYGVTKFADLTAEEFSQKFLGLNMDIPMVGDDECTDPSNAEILTLPDNFDWTEQKDIVNPVQDQAQCGSCWAFATTAAVESANAIAGNGLMKLSEQQLVDCDKTNSGCNGGNMLLAEHYVKENGQTYEDDYPYAGVDQTCQDFTPYAYISKACYIDSTLFESDEEIEDQMRYHLYHTGPVVVGINANKAQLYISGIMTADYCNPNGVDHAVLAVGYGEEDGTKFWKIRNSWGSSWGEEGYFRMVRNEDACGVNTSASYVLV